MSGARTATVCAAKPLKQAGEQNNKRRYFRAMKFIKTMPEYTTQLLVSSH